jgi:hypothetical protein
MAEDTTDDRGPTRRVVLKRERTLVLPEGVRVEELVAAKDEKAIMKLLGKPIGKDPYTEAWTVVAVKEGASKTNAIEAHAGKPGTPDALPGTYKAPTVSAWSGGEVYEAPPEPLVERKALEEDLG